MQRGILALLFAIFTSCPIFTYAMANTPSPIGKWNILSNKTHMVKAVIDVHEQNGTLEGTVTKLIRRPDQTQNPVCEHCQGAYANKPVRHMTLIWGLTQNGDNWDGGHIIDPSNGKIYELRMTPSPNGKTMEVRGYIGIPTFGKSQTWYRE